MKYFFKHLFIILSVTSVSLFATSTVSAASFSVMMPERAPANGEPFSVVVTLDTEGKTLSGIGGSLSFDERLFSVDSISTGNSVVTPWIEFPRVSFDQYFDNRTHIVFEGIFAGGFGGVKSANYKGAKEGKVFTVTLRPKSTGETTIVLDSLTLRSFDETASEIPVQSVIKKITVAPGTIILSKNDIAQRRIDNKGLTVVIAKSDLINNGNLYLVIDDKELHSSITDMYVAESSSYNGDLLSQSEWRSARNPYVLQLQDRSKYIHVKVIYSDNTYTIKTIEPVDNLQGNKQNSHILLSIGMLIIAFCLYVYNKKYTIRPQRKT